MRDNFEDFDLIESEIGPPEQNLPARLGQASVGDVLQNSEQAEHIEPNNAVVHQIGEQAISLSNRISYAETEQSTGHEPTKVTDIAAETEMPISWVIKNAQSLGIEMTMDYFGGNLIPHFPAYTSQVLKQELAWQRQLAQADLLLTNWKMAKLVGRSKEWTRKNVQMMGIEPAKTDEYRPDLTRKLYPKETVMALRYLALSHPSQNGNFTMNQLEQITGQERKWINRRLEKLDIEPVLCRTEKSGLIVKSYSPEVAGLMIKEAKQRPAYAGEWLTKKALAAKLGQSYRWINSQIEQYQQLAEQRQDDSGISRLHYPPVIVEMLKHKAQELKDYNQQGDYLTLANLSANLGRSNLWVKNRLQQLAVKTEKRFDRSGRLRTHYAPEILDKLKKLNNQ